MLKLKGNSGCQIGLSRADEYLWQFVSKSPGSAIPVPVIHSENESNRCFYQVVRKSTNSVSYAIRLLRQCEKQQSFLEVTNSLPYVATPEIICVEVTYAETGSADVVESTASSLRHVLTNKDASLFELAMCRTQTTLTFSSRKGSGKRGKIPGREKGKSVWERTPSPFLTAVRELLNWRCIVGISFDMLYVPHQDILQFLQCASPTQLEGFATVLLDILRQYQERSSLQAVPLSIFVKKLREVENNILCMPSDLIDGDEKRFITMGIIPHVESLLRRYSERVTPTHGSRNGGGGESDEGEDNCKEPCVYIPVGCCHGDLTLSNILLITPTENNLWIQHQSCHSAHTAAVARKNVEEATPSLAFNQSITLIDFLDSFLESVVVDLAKLYQDLGYGWTLLLTLHEHYCSGRTNDDDDHSSSVPLCIASTLCEDEKRNFLSLQRASRIVWEIIKCSFTDGAEEEGNISHRYQWFCRFFFPVFLLNQLRVVQYCKERHLVQYLLRTIVAEYERMGCPLPGVPVHKSATDLKSEPLLPFWEAHT